MRIRRLAVIGSVRDTRQTCRPSSPVAAGLYGMQRRRPSPARIWSRNATIPLDLVVLGALSVVLYSAAPRSWPTGVSGVPPRSTDGTPVVAMDRDMAVLHERRIGRRSASWMPSGPRVRTGGWRAFRSAESKVGPPAAREVSDTHRIRLCLMSSPSVRRGRPRVTWRSPELPRGLRHRLMYCCLIKARAGRAARRCAPASGPPPRACRPSPSSRRQRSPRRRSPVRPPPRR